MTAAAVAVARPAVRNHETLSPGGSALPAELVQPAEAEARRCSRRPDGHPAVQSVAG